MSAQVSSPADSSVDASSAGAAMEAYSPALPAPDPAHDARFAASVARAYREIPFYRRRAPDAATPLLFKREVASTLPRLWVPSGTDVRAELDSGALELVETSGSTGDRLRVLWDAG